MSASGMKEYIQPHPFGTATVLRLTSHPELVSLADRIAQAIVAPVVQAAFLVVDDLSDSHRGVGGFGSTGRG